MMANKNHEEYISYFKNIKSITAIDIPNTPNALNGKKLKEKFSTVTSDVQYKESIKEAIKSISLNKNDVVIITGSLYLASEVLKIN
jgi:dihydrofolate synthase/folylpolyglutamate synthase